MTNSVVIKKKRSWCYDAVRTALSAGGRGFGVMMNSVVMKRKRS